MSIEQLITEHLDIWTAADTEKKSGRGRSSGSAGNVYGIKKLRELILELAVRGKLVPQDDSDEPASELLKRIAAEKAKLVAEGKIKKSKPLAEITDDEKPFELPVGWEWSRLGQIGVVSSSSRIHQKDWTDSGIPFYRAREIVILSKLGHVDNELFITQELFKTLTNNGIIPEHDDLMITGVGTIGVPYIVKKTDKFYFKDASVLIFKNHFKLFTGYIYNFLISPYWINKIHSESMGTTVHTLTIVRANEVLVSIPPIAEQHRIVAKVDELMALCDQLENQHNNAAEAHEKLVTHLLGTLTQSQNAEDFNTHRQRISEHFDTLFTTEASIDALKQTLLQLAVMGKLVPQDPNDEPASELLKDIVKTKDQLIKTKKYQKTGKLKQKEFKVNYPESWAVVQTGEVCPSVVPSRDKPKSFSGDIPWITLPSFPSDGWYLDTSTLDLGLTLEEASEYTARIIPESSVLMSCVGRFGLTAINQIPVIPNQQIHAFIIISGLVPEFLCIVIQAVVKQMEDMATSTTIPYLNKSNCESIEFGLPPFLEQTRIVAKVDELMAACDQLKSQITSANQLQQKLANVVVENTIYE